MHSFQPISSKELEVRAYSSSNDKRIECVSSVKKDYGKIIKLSAIQGYVTASYDGSWWLGCITKSMPDSQEVEVFFLHPKGPTKSFKYPPAGDILVKSHQDILTIVNPSTATGRVYTLTQEEMDLASASLASC